VSDLGKLLRRSVVYVLVAGLSFFIGFVLLNFVVLPLFVKSEDTTKVPDLVGLEYEQARLLCEERELVLEKRGERYEEDIAPGFVLSQDPLPELLIKKGRRIDVVVSMGQELTSIPDITGLEADRARSILETSGLRVIGERSESSENMAEGRVLAVEPSPGSRVKGGTEVTLIVSTGPLSFVMPLLEERTLEEAKRIVGDMGLVVGRVEYVRTDLPIGTVIGQEPPAGSQVVNGQHVELVISSGE
jgi:serine/threonine-protein kinase